MKKLVLKPDAEPIFSSSKLADKEVSAKEREKSSCSKTNTKRGNLIQLCVSILFCEKNWIF